MVALVDMDRESVTSIGAHHMLLRTQRAESTASTHSRTYELTTPNFILGRNNSDTVRCKNDISDSNSASSPTHLLPESPSAKLNTLLVDSQLRLRRSEATHNLIETHELSPTVFMSPYITLRKSKARLRSPKDLASSVDQDSREQYSRQQVEASAQAIAELERKGTMRPMPRKRTANSRGDSDSSLALSDKHHPACDPEGATASAASMVSMKLRNMQWPSSAAASAQVGSGAGSVQDRRRDKLARDKRIARAEWARSIDLKAPAKCGVYLSHEIYRSSQRTRPVVEMLREVLEVRYPIAESDANETHANEDAPLIGRMRNQRVGSWWMEWPWKA